MTIELPSGERHALASSGLIDLLTPFPAGTPDNLDLISDEQFRAAVVSALAALGHRTPAARRRVLLEWEQAFASVAIPRLQPDGSVVYVSSGRGWRLAEVYGWGDEE